MPQYITCIELQIDDINHLGFPIEPIFLILAGIGRKQIPERQSNGRKQSLINAPFDRTPNGWT